jgi:UDP-N-acetylmuramoyl-tripeptide--D-alanyl-D-alanine ligase
VRPRRLSQVADEVGGTVHGADVRVTSVATDSRLVVPGSLFFALRGDRTDGHGFVDDALALGAAAVVVESSTGGVIPRLEVPAPADALLALATDERRAFEGPVVAITGANGKTSTKDLAAAVLAERFRVQASPESFNNEVGLPMTLLGAAEDDEVIVAELGARRVGDVALLMRIAEPSVVVVTNVGVAHIGVFGSWEAIVESSREPVEGLRSDGLAVLNADDPVASGFATPDGARRVTFGRAADADVRAEAVTVAHDGRATFDLVGGGGRGRVKLVVPGEHMIANALAAGPSSRTGGWRRSRAAAGFGC